MSYFVAIVDLSSDKELVDCTVAAHRAYLQTLLEAGKLVISGPWEDETGALFIFEAEDQAEAERLLAEDPYRSAGVMTNARIKEWRVAFDRGGR